MIDLWPYQPPSPLYRFKKVHLKEPNCWNLLKIISLHSNTLETQTIMMLKNIYKSTRFPTCKFLQGFFPMGSHNKIVCINLQNISNSLWETAAYSKRFLNLRANTAGLGNCSKQQIAFIGSSSSLVAAPTHSITSTV